MRDTQTRTEPGSVGGRGVLDLPGVLGNPLGSGKPGRAGTTPRGTTATGSAAGGSAARGRRRQAPPGSTRQSVRVLAALAVTAVGLLGVTDGPAAAGLGSAVVISAGLCIARYVAGAGSRDQDPRRRARLLGGSNPVLGGWQWLVHNALGADGDAYFTERLRPQLQRLFAARLAGHHGTDLHRAPERARALVGEELWPWIDPSWPPPRPSVPPDVLRTLLQRLDALGEPESRTR